MIPTLWQKGTQKHRMFHLLRKGDVRKLSRRNSRMRYRNPSKYKKKFAGPSAHGVSDPAPATLLLLCRFFLYQTARARRPLGPPGQTCTTRRRPWHFFSALWCSKVRFFRFLGPSGRRPKMMIFQHRRKILKIRRYVEPGGPLWYHFFNVFLNDLQSKQAFVYQYFSMVLDHPKPFIVRSVFH